MNSTESEVWPALPFAEWEATCDTLHMWTQIVGKTRMALSPPQNHWWHVTLYVTPRGLIAPGMCFGDIAFEAEFDFVSHELVLSTSAGRMTTVRLFPRSVADFYVEYMSALHSLGIEVKINPKPQEFDDTTPFDEDRHHASYDREYVERFRRILIGADLVFRRFRAGFTGKCSPVHFFWGSFDLAVTRFNGKQAAPREGADPVTREAYSHEVISCGFWPGSRAYPQAAFYAYAAPVIPDLDKQKILPEAAGWDAQLGEFILKYDIARSQPNTGKSVLDFCRSTYDAAANLGRWDASLLR
ncbi:MAG TPA: DUF5996 family protein [Bryobacteraceae bacterium]|nr:DUF5996 family protein [Bryobacteraceae bacterium]